MSSLVAITSPKLSSIGQYCRLRLRGWPLHALLSRARPALYHYLMAVSVVLLRRKYLMPQNKEVILLVLLSSLLSFTPLIAQTAATSPQPRARDLGIPFDGTPGPLNAITDVAGVEVGYKTLVSGEGRLVVGKGPVRTGVTA